MNIERMNHLITVMEIVRDAHKPFSIRAWITNDINTVQSSPTTDVPKHLCGTTACALGYAALDSKFKEQGLSLEGRYFTCDENDSVIALSLSDVETYNSFLHNLPENARSDVVAVPLFGDDQGFVAGQTFFDISYRASEYLFSPGFYPGQPGPDEVIEHIKEVIALNGAAPQPFWNR